MKKTTSIAIGGFDGMHIGHQQLFNVLGDNGAVVVIETGHANMTPGMLRQDHTSYPLKIYELACIKHLDDIGFVEKLLKDFPLLDTIVVGYDFHFGKDRAFSASDLQKNFKGKVVVINEVKYHEVSVHSHVIRNYLKEGAIVEANEMLGHNYSIRGTVVKGQGLGSKSLFPTLNIQSEQLLPKEGVYVTLTRLNDDVSFHPSVSFIGHRVTTDGEMAIESHLLQTVNIEVECLEMVFIDFLRENQKFENLELLKAAISNDIKKAQNKLQKLAL